METTGNRLPENVLFKNDHKAKLKARIKMIKHKQRTRQRGVVFVGHIPHGFYEGEMKRYFSQFGHVTRIRLAVSKKTGKAKGFGFIEFGEKDVARIVCDTMNNYLMFHRLLKCELIPDEKVHPLMFKHTGQRYVKPDLAGLAAKAYNRPKNPERINNNAKRVLRNCRMTSNKMAAAGINYSFEYKHTRVKGKKASVAKTTASTAAAAKVLASAKKQLRVRRLSTDAAKMDPAMVAKSVAIARKQHAREQLKASMEKGVPAEIPLTKEAISAAAKVRKELNRKQAMLEKARANRSGKRAAAQIDASTDTQTKGEGGKQTAGMTQAGVASENSGESPEPSAKRVKLSNSPKNTKQQMVGKRKARKSKDVVLSPVAQAAPKAQENGSTKDVGKTGKATETKGATTKTTSVKTTTTSPKKAAKTKEEDGKQTGVASEKGGKSAPPSAKKVKLSQSPKNTKPQTGAKGKASKGAAVVSSSIAQAAPKAQVNGSTKDEGKSGPETTKASPKTTKARPKQAAAKSPTTAPVMRKSLKRKAKD